MRKTKVLIAGAFVAIASLMFTVPVKASPGEARAKKEVLNFGSAYLPVAAASLQLTSPVLVMPVSIKLEKGDVYGPVKPDHFNQVFIKAPYQPPVELYRSHYKPILKPGEQILKLPNPITWQSKNPPDNYRGIQPERTYRI